MEAREASVVSVVEFQSAGCDNLGSTDTRGIKSNLLEADEGDRRLAVLLAVRQNAFC